MKIAIAAIPLSYLVTSADATSDGVCTKYENHYGWTSGNYLSALFPANSANGHTWEWEECAEKCAMHESCEFWTLRLTGNKACLLMKNAGVYYDGWGHLEGGRDPDCITSVSQPTPPPAPSPTSDQDGVCTKFENRYGWTSGQYLNALYSANGQPWEWQECAELCAMHEGCEFWTLRLTGDEACLLMKNAGTYHNGWGHLEGIRDADCITTTSSPSKNPTPFPTTANPTKNPTPSPTTASPTKNPTPSPTTATPTFGPTSEPTVDEGPSPKKGIGMHVPQSCNALDDYDGASWWYDWGEIAFRRGICDDPAAAAMAAHNNGKEFVPMLWSHVPSQPFSEEFKANLENANYLMTFNEPERSDQANISPFYAAQLWPQVVSIAKEYNLQLVAPCGTIDHGITWYEEWLLSCEEMYADGCEYDFTCLHAYFQPLPCDGIPGWACVSAVMNKIDNWKDKFGKPTWVTEFACNPWVGNCDAQKQHDLMQQLVPQLEQSDSVFRYAWFEAYGSDFGGANTNEMIFEHASKKSCPNKSWLAGVGPDPSWQVTKGSMTECLAKADQSPACHTPAIISLDNDSCYCSTDACPNLISAYEGMNTWREVGERGSSNLSDLGLFYQNV